MNSIKRTARRASLLWLLMSVAGGFGLIYIRSYVIVPGDAAATAGNVLASESLFRAAITAAIFAQILLFFFGLSIFHLFKKVDKWLATVLLASVMMAVVIGVVNAFNHIGALIVLGQPDYLKVFSTEQINAIAMLFLRQSNTGQALLEIFWPSYYFSFGLLIIKSRYLPKIFGIMLMVASAGFAINLLDKFLIPQFYPAFFTQLAMTLGALCLLPTLFWLLIMGAKAPEAAG